MNNVFFTINSIKNNNTSVMIVQLIYETLHKFPDVYTFSEKYPN